MAEITPSELSALQASFAAHIGAFHDGLPPAEQAMLQQVFTQAQSGRDEAADVQGFDWMWTSPIVFVPEIPPAPAVPGTSWVWSGITWVQVA